MIAERPWSEIEKLKLYLRIKWGIIGITFFWIFIQHLLGFISWITIYAAFTALFLASLTALLLRAALRRKLATNLLAYLSLFFDLIIIVAALYFIGGSENTWVFLPVFVIFVAGYLFTPAASYIYAGTSFFLVLTMVLLEYYKLIPHFSIYDLPENYWRIPERYIDYLIGMFLLYFLGAFASGRLNQLVEQRAERIEEYSRELERSHAEALALEEKGRRAKEELEKKVAELEKFRKVTVARELKMIELKKEIERLKRHA